MITNSKRAYLDKMLGREFQEGVSIYDELSFWVSSQRHDLDS